MLKGDEEYYLQEVLLSRHARKLLRNRNLKQFVMFGEIVERPLRMWLYREKSRDANIPEEEVGNLIDTIAIQFDVSVFKIDEISLKLKVKLDSESKIEDFREKSDLRYCYCCYHCCYCC